MAQTGVTRAQARALCQSWDVIGGTSELYRFYFGEFREIQQTASVLGFAPERLNEIAISYYRYLADELEKVTWVSETDIMGTWERTYTRDDLLGFDKAADDYEKETALGFNGREIEMGQLPDEVFAEEAEVTPNPLADEEGEEILSWIPLGEAEGLDAVQPNWFKQQPREYVKLLDAIEEAAPADLPALGKELYTKAKNFTKAQRMVAFETYARAKEKALAWTERHLNTDARKVRRAILKAGGRGQLAQLAQRIHQGQKEGKAQINSQEWAALWKIYQQRKAQA